MMWDDDAEKRFELLPVPPMMKSYARLQAEKIARGRGLSRVTDACVRETERVYRDFIGEEKTEQLRAYVTGEGPEPQLMDELFLMTSRRCTISMSATPNTVRTASW